MPSLRSHFPKNIFSLTLDSQIALDSPTQTVDYGTEACSGAVAYPSICVDFASVSDIPPLSKTYFARLLRQVSTSLDAVR